MQLQTAYAEMSVVDWVIDYPDSLGVFQEFSIDYCCAGKSLEGACYQANANLAVVLAKLRIIATRADAPPLASPGCSCRPMSLWIDHSPPGWTSRYSALEADPLSLATEIHELGQSVLEWLKLPAKDRWDNFKLQALSAALFNRYLAEDGQGKNKDSKELVELPRLRWPPRTEAIQCCVVELRQMLRAPLAVYKAVRVPLSAELCPTADELQRAEATLLNQRATLAAVIHRLGQALSAFAADRLAGAST